ncbi:hypothetical protein [Dolichospermum circinale]|uniref:Transposase n=1 Tax=Dolichospermum circinale CS-537/01 TaxID=3021739 RepID=A0ABT5A4L6_9CYAN|nr:hypothetical protein [Dolichospermum circinale]MDB9486872.1 hypothetical protein [Dolichospermum circinale CS-537/01]
MTREQGTGNREQGNFTFRYLCRFFSVHLLKIILKSLAVNKM